MNNHLDLLESNYCDPYCRDITLVSVVETYTSNIFDAVARQAPNKCDTELILTLQVEGTYWTCEGYPFPGLFSDPLSVGSEASNMTSDELIRMISGDEMCQQCSEESTHDGLIAPSPLDLLEAMKPYATVLDPICDLLSAEVLDDGR
jgi:hypothetical protein